MENTKLNKIDFCIKAVKQCTKSLMRLSFKNYCYTEQKTEKISNKNIGKNNY